MWLFYSTASAALISRRFKYFSNHKQVFHLLLVELRGDGGVGIEGGRVKHRSAGSRRGSWRLRLTSKSSWLLKLLWDELLLLLLLRNKLLLLTLLLLGSKLLLLGLLLGRPGPGCEDQLKLIRSDVDLLRLCS